MHGVPSPSLPKQEYYQDSLCGLWYMEPSSEQLSRQLFTRGGHSHMHHSHGCVRGQNAVNGQNGFSEVGQRSKCPK